MFLFFAMSISLNLTMCFPFSGLKLESVLIPLLHFECLQCCHVYCILVLTKNKLRCNPHKVQSHNWWTNNRIRYGRKLKLCILRTGDTHKLPGEFCFSLSVNVIDNITSIIFIGMLATVTLSSLHNNSSTKKQEMQMSSLVNLEEKLPTEKDRVLARSKMMTTNCSIFVTQWQCRSRTYDWCTRTHQYQFHWMLAKTVKIVTVVHCVRWYTSVRWWPVWYGEVKTGAFGVWTGELEPRSSHMTPPTLYTLLKLPFITGLWINRYIAK